MKFLPAFLLLLLVPVLVWGGYQLSQSDPPPPYREAARESRLLLPLLRGEGEVEMRISLRMRGSDPFARALRRVTLTVSGPVGRAGSALRFRLQAGSRTATWSEITLGPRRALVVRGTPYRSRESFLGQPWAKALLPAPLLRAWRNLPPAYGGEDEGAYWSYQTRGDWGEIFWRRSGLLRALRPSPPRLLFARDTGAPGGVAWVARNRDVRELLGAGSGKADWMVSYRVLRWQKKPLRISFPQKLWPGGSAALDSALLPFFEGMQTP